LPLPPARTRPDFAGPLREWARLPLCTVEEERDLATRAQAGDTAARDELAGRNLRLVAEVAATQMRPGREIDDLIGWGWFGLLLAIDRFDPARGVRFATFAWREIRSEIQRGLGFARKMGFRPHPCLSQLEADDLPAFDPPDHREPPPGAGAELADEREWAERLLAGLAAREAGVIRGRFGIGGERLTLAECGRRLGITKKWARVIERTAMRKLKAAAGDEGEGRDAG
jgi:RNA polymerase sporulation-specific sigma factor